MKTIEIEGIRLTEELISFIRQCQEEPEFMAAQVDVIDSAITLIACDCTPEGEKVALNAIADLSFLKRYVRLFEGKDKTK
ncbi:MAG: hypothetical protein LUH63_20575 [Parabacteroides sp.]|nr:hypothetical protein [Parabacteroides sp.]